MNDNETTELLDCGVIYPVKSISINSEHNKLTITFENGDKIIVHPDGYETLVVAVELNRGAEYII